MRAWRFHEFGDIANYTLEEVLRPEAADGEVLIKLRYASLNPADRLLIEGKYPGAGALPLTVGRDGAGTVETAEEGSRFKVGDEVIVLRSEIGITRQGTLAEYVAALQDAAEELTDNVSEADALVNAALHECAWREDQADVAA